MPAAVSTLVLAPTPDSARVQLRNALATYFHAQPTAAPAGYSRWAAPATQAVNRPPRLLVGDPVTLMVSRCFFLTHPSIPHLTPHQKKTGEPQDPQAVHQAPLAGLPRARHPPGGARPAPLPDAGHVPAQPPVVRAPRQAVPGARRTLVRQDHQAPSAPRGLRQVSPGPTAPPGLRARQVPPAL